MNSKTGTGNLGGHMTYRQQSLLTILLSVILQDIYLDLVHKKAKIEEQLKEISLALNGMEVTYTNSLFY